eukprot:g4266.t1
MSSFSKSGFRNSVFEAPVIMEGWLKKHSTGLIKRWQKRYFTIAGHYMKYYDDETKNEKALKGTIDLNGLQSAAQTALEGELQLVIKGETIILHAESAADGARWINILEPMIGIGVDENPLFRMRARPAAQQKAMQKEKADREAKNKAAQADAALKRKASTSAAVAGMARSVRRPLRVRVHRAAGLRAARDSSNPTVCVTAVDRTHGYEQEVQHFIGTEFNTTSPAFEAEVVLPGVTANVDIVFTVVDFGDDGSMQFLGQASVSMGGAERWSKPVTQEKLVLGPKGDCLPRDGGGQELALEYAEAPATWDGSEASLVVSTEPFPPSYSLCGALDKTGGDRYASVWKPRWCCLVEHELRYYDHYGVATPKAVIDMRQAKAVEHPDSIIEHITVQMPEKLWQFRTATVVEGGQWWWKLRQAAGMATDTQHGAKPGISIQQSEHAGAVPVRKLSSW